MIQYQSHNEYLYDLYASFPYSFIIVFRLTFSTKIYVMYPFLLVFQSKVIIDYLKIIIKVEQVDFVDEMDFINMELKHNYTIKVDKLIKTMQVMEGKKVIDIFKVQIIKQMDFIQSF